MNIVYLRSCSPLLQMLLLCLEFVDLIQRADVEVLKRQRDEAIDQLSDFKDCTSFMEDHVQFLEQQNKFLQEESNSRIVTLKSELETAGRIYCHMQAGAFYCLTIDAYCFY